MSLLRPGRGAVYCDQLSVSMCVSVCLFVSISSELLDQSLQNLACRSRVTVARSSLGSVALHYVLQVLWMTSHLAVVGRMSIHGLSVTKYSASGGVVRQGRSLMSMNALLLLVFV